MDHPLKADVVTTHRALWKQCDPSELTKCTQTQTDLKVTLTHTNVIKYYKKLACSIIAEKT